MPDEILTKQMFNLAYEIGRNWSQYIKDILYEINVQEEFVIKNVFYLNNVESKCIDLDKSEWLNYTDKPPPYSATPPTLINYEASLNDSR